MQGWLVLIHFSGNIRTQRHTHHIPKSYYKANFDSLTVNSYLMTKFGSLSKYFSYSEFSQPNKGVIELKKLKLYKIYIWLLVDLLCSFSLFTTALYIYYHGVQIALDSCTLTYCIFIFIIPSSALLIIHAIQKLQFNMSQLVEIGTRNQMRFCTVIIHLTIWSPKLSEQTISLFESKKCLKVSN